MTLRQIFLLGLLGLVVSFSLGTCLNKRHAQGDHARAQIVKAAEWGSSS